MRFNAKIFPCLNLLNKGNARLFELSILPFLSGSSPPGMSYAYWLCYDPVGKHSTPVKTRVKNTNEYIVAKGGTVTAFSKSTIYLIRVICRIVSLGVIDFSYLDEFGPRFFIKVNQYGVRHAVHTKPLKLWTYLSTCQCHQVSLLVQSIKTLSLRKFAYDFAQHKEVLGDQLKPSKERIKNVNISNQQRRC
jgi:hypothetical protein